MLPMQTLQILLTIPIVLVAGAFLLVAGLLLLRGSPFLMRGIYSAVLVDVEFALILGSLLLFLVSTGESNALCYGIPQVIIFGFMVYFIHRRTRGYTVIGIEDFTLRLALKNALKAMGKSFEETKRGFFFRATGDELRVQSASYFAIGHFRFEMGGNRTELHQIAQQLNQELHFYEIEYRTVLVFGISGLVCVYLAIRQWLRI